MFIVNEGEMQRDKVKIDETDNKLDDVNGYIRDCILDVLYRNSNRSEKRTWKDEGELDESVKENSMEVIGEKMDAIVYSIFSKLSKEEKKEVAILGEIRYAIEEIGMVIDEKIEHCQERVLIKRIGYSEQADFNKYDECIFKRLHYRRMQNRDKTWKNEKQLDEPIKEDSSEISQKKLGTVICSALSKLSEAEKNELINELKLFDL